MTASVTHSAPRGETVPNSLEPEHGWHCSHFFYRFNRTRLAELGTQISDVKEQLLAVLAPESPTVCPRQQSYITVGHKADFAVMAMGPDPLQINRLHQSLMAGTLGTALECTWSFVSISEISEYVPSPEDFAKSLQRDGMNPESEEFRQRVASYSERLPMMNHQRLKPNIPDWPAACFYPMNKSRVVGANWFTESASRRSELMAEHGRSGMAFMGRVSQLITVGVGLDDWEWMVTLWGRNPQYLKDIVYKMRFDEASAKYAEFGPFYTAYRATASEIWDHCQFTRSAK
jgi:hydrogen peroxide-dependent heme synthase